MAHGFPWAMMLWSITAGVAFTYDVRSGSDAVAEPIRPHRRPWAPTPQHAEQPPAAPKTQNAMPAQ
jgi:hypothetical protein